MRWGRALGALVVVVVIAAVVALRARPPEVSVMIAERRELVQTVVASGRVLPAARVELAALGLGRVIAVGPREGARVERGALLAELDHDAADAELARADAVVAQARSRLAQVRGASAQTAAEALRRADTSLARARDELSRLERLSTSGGVTAQEVERARTQVALEESTRETAHIQLGAARGAEGRQAAAELARAEADLAAAEARRADRTILAPVAGVVVARAIDEGDVVTAGQRMFEIVADGPIEVRIDPDESSLALIELGQSALVSPEAFPDRRLAARVARIAHAVDPQRGTIEVRLEVPDEAHELRADMTVSVDIEVARRADALVLPLGAVRGVGTRTPWALVVEGDTAMRRELRLGAIGEERIEIVGGLEDGERAIPSDAVGIEAGSRVRVRDAE